MRLLLDENISEHRRAARLKSAGHDLVVDGSVGLLSVTDPRVLAWAICERRATMTHDHEDFTDLHDLILAAGGHHPGILIVRDDGDPRHRMSAQAIATALARLQASGTSLPDHLHVLNHWQ
ncbi:MAG TPA: DUF5615 family PIN-like protein [Isosphaeraceae bacterium]|jgi:predicted nuclease of predicted toxin-antitoxin system|nr:DUF5615 family PIN-like protein [Isosphaeraceae bacterium]